MRSDSSSDTRTPAMQQQQQQQQQQQRRNALRISLTAVLTMAAPLIAATASAAVTLPFECVALTPTAAMDPTFFCGVIAAAPASLAEATASGDAAAIATAATAAAFALPTGLSPRALAQLAQSAMFAGAAPNSSTASLLATASAAAGHAGIPVASNCASALTAAICASAFRPCAAPLLTALAAQGSPAPRILSSADEVGLSTTLLATAANSVAATPATLSASAALAPQVSLLFSAGSNVTDFGGFTAALDGFLNPREEIGAHTRSLTFLHTRLPYDRPCRSLCSAAAQACAPVVVLAASVSPALGAAARSLLNCTALSASTGLAVYDGLSPPRSGLAVPFGSNASYVGDASAAETCNDLGPRHGLFRVQQLFEPYARPLGSASPGICAAVFGSESNATTAPNIFLPHAPLVTSQLAAMPPPGMLQAVLESALEARFAKLPLFLTPECVQAFKTLLCASAFKPAQAVSAQLPSPFGSYFENLYLPQYPAQSLCLHYREACGSFIQSAKESSPELDIDCAAMDPLAPSQQSYPEQERVAMVLAMPTGTVLIVTQTNNYSDSAMAQDYSPQCPYGFVVPEAPGHPRVNWVTGTACAVQCPFPFFRPHEFEWIFSFLRWISSVGQLFFLVVFAVFTAFPEKRKSGRMFLVFTTLIFIESTAMWLQVIASESYEDTVCSSNATGASQLGDVTPEQAGLSAKGLAITHSCAAVGGIVLWAVRAGFLIWTMQAIDLFLRVGLQSKSADNYFWYYVASAMLVSTVLTITMAGRQVLGYGDGHTTCAIAGTGEDMLAFILVPDLISHTIGTIFSLLTLRTMVDVARRTGAGSWGRTVRMFRTPLAFLVGFLALTVGFASYEWKLHIDEASMGESVVEWAGCIFKQFGAGATEEEYLETCGDRPAKSPAIDAVIWNCVAVAGNGVVVAIITINWDLVKRLGALLGFKVMQAATHDQNSTTKRAGRGLASSAPVHPGASSQSPQSPQSPPKKDGKTLQRPPSDNDSSSSTTAQSTPSLRSPSEGQVELPRPSVRVAMAGSGAMTKFAGAESIV